MASTRDKLRRMPGSAVLLVCALGILIAFLGVGPGSIYLTFHAHSDFRSFYSGATMLGSGGLYDVDRVQDLQRQLFGGTIRSLLPIRLPFYYAFLSLLAWVPFGVAQWFWLAAMALATLAFVSLSAGLGRISVAIACCWSWPLLFNLPLGQDVPLVLLFLSAALWAIYARKNWWLAGLLFSLCLIKFHLFLLVPLLILGKRKWRLAAGLVTGTACLMAISFLAAGFEWPRQYIAVILDPLGSPGLAAMPNLHGLMFNFNGLGAPEYLFSFAVLGMVWWVIRHRPFGVAAAATLVGSVLLSQHSYLADCAILIPALLTLVRPANGLIVRGCAAVLLLPLPYAISHFKESGSLLAVLLLLLLLAIALDSSYTELSRPSEISYPPTERTESPAQRSLRHWRAIAIHRGCRDAESAGDMDHAPTCEQRGNPQARKPIAQMVADHDVRC
jgi:hypothetical protein